MKVFALLFAAALAVSAGTLTVSVKDPSGAVVPGATVRLQASIGSAQKNATGSNGVALFPDLAAGNYQVAIQSQGFALFQATAIIKPAGDTLLEANLTIAPQGNAIEVEEKTTALANADPIYRALRGASLTETFLVENLELKRDVGTFTFLSGAFSFPAPVLGRVVTAVFSGRGSFQLIPAVQLEGEHIQLITGQSHVSEEFESAVLVFTDKTYEELKRSLKTPADGSRNATVLRDVHRLLRRRVETPRTITEELLQSEDVDNVEADVLADLYNSQAEGFFSAYIHGRKRSDLRFFVRPRGAIPEILSTEEVGLVNIDPNGTQDGIFYLTHLASEWKNGTALQDEDRRIAAARHYKVDTAIGKNEHLASVTTLQFEPLRDGDRILRLSLLPNLRVSRVSLRSASRIPSGSASGSKDIGFIQEGRRLDSSFN